MTTIRAAELLPGVALDSLAAADRTSAGSARPQLIRGRALIFWDPKVPGKKLDAIDTDQITPSTDCISESLDRLDRHFDPQIPTSRRVRG